MAMRTYKFKLEPTVEQQKKMIETLSLCRWLYNTCLEQRMYEYKTHKKSCELARYVAKDRVLWDNLVQLGKVKEDKGLGNFRGIKQKDDSLQKIRGKQRINRLNSIVVFLINLSFIGFQTLM